MLHRLPWAHGMTSPTAILSDRPNACPCSEPPISVINNIASPQINLWNQPFVDCPFIVVVGGWPVCQYLSRSQSCDHLTRSVLIHLQRCLCIYIMGILKEAFTAPDTSLSIVGVLAVMTVQAVRALAPLTIDAYYLSTLVAQSELLGRGKLGQHVVLISAPITLVAVICQVIMVAKVAALSVGFIIEGSSRADVGGEQTLVHALVGRVEKDESLLGNGGGLLVEVDYWARGQLGHDCPRRRWCRGWGGSGGGSRRHD